MGIKEQQAIQQSKFISMRNLIDSLSSIEKIHIRDVASFLLRTVIGDGTPAILYQNNFSFETRRVSHEIQTRLLTHVAESNSYQEGESSDIREDDFDSHGWNREAMSDFLERLKIEIPPCCHHTWIAPAKGLPWHLAYSSRERLTINEAVALILGIDPEDQIPLNDNNLQADYSRWRKALIDGIGNFNFDESTWSRDQGEQSFLHSGIKAWASYTGAPWPFIDESISNKSLEHKSLDLSSPNYSGARPEIVQRLAAAEVKAEQLAFELANVTRELNQARNEIERLTTCLVEATKAANIAQADVTALKTQLTDQSNLLSTQGRNSALLIMAALAKEARLDVSQPSRTGEILSSSVSELGCSLTGRAISSWLSDIPRVLETRSK